MPRIDRRPAVIASVTAACALTLVAATGDVARAATAEQLQILAQSLNPFSGRQLYVDPNSNARRQAETWKRSRPADAALMQQIARNPVARWVGGWVTNVQREVGQAAKTMTSSGALPVFVAYNIPSRDCGSYSAGGAADATRYRKWIGDFGRGLEGRDSVVILEPDALAGMDCLDAARQQERVTLIREAVTTLKSQGGHVYIDAGHAKWHPAPTMAKRLRDAGIAQAAGFALNVSNVHSTAANVAYGEQLSKLLGGKHFVIDTSRNGAPGADPRQWCNPQGRALGVNPTTNTGHPLVDAFLWIKAPGESDGTCRGGPPAGTWWAHYALELSRMAARLSGVSQ